MKFQSKGDYARTRASDFLHLQAVHSNIFWGEYAKIMLVDITISNITLAYSQKKNSNSLLEGAPVPA